MATRAKRTIIRPTRFTEGEWRTVQRRARECGLQPTVFMRIASLGAVPRKRRTSAGQALAHQLARIGNNLNQLTRRANAGLPIPVSELKDVLQTINEKIRDL